MGISPLELAELIKPCYKPQKRLRSLICHDCLSPATMWYGHYKTTEGAPVITAGHCSEHPSLNADPDGALQIPDHVSESIGYCLEQLEY